jgi:O-antigen/teichoic acid export membrane protein
MSSDTTHEAPPRPLTGGVLIGAASRIGATVAGAATTVVLARLLGPAGWGRYAVAQSLVVIVVGATTLGVEHGITYFVSAGKWAARAAFDSAMTVAAIAGTVGALAALAVRLTVPSAFAGMSVALTGIAVAAVPFVLARVYTSYIALAIDRYEAAMAVPAAQAVLLLALVVIGAVIAGVTGAVVAMAAGLTGIGVAAFIWGRRRLPPSRSSSPGQLRRAIAFGVKGYAANALQAINYRLDLFILAAVASTVAVGNYALAVSVATLIWILPEALSEVVYPRIARLSGGSGGTASEMVETKSLRHVSLAVVLGALALAAALELLVVPVFGETFRPAVNLGLILLPGACAIGISTVLAATVVGRGHPRYSLYGALITTPLTLAMYAVLIPWLHATGAALASTVSYLATFALFCHFYRRVTGRNALPLLVPTRSELADLHAVYRAAGPWLARRA